MSETPISSFEANNRLSSLLNRAERGERIWEMGSGDGVREMEMGSGNGVRKWGQKWGQKLGQASKINLLRQIFKF